MEEQEKQQDGKQHEASGLDAWHIGLIFLGLGCRAGGPTARVALFRDEFVGKKEWLDDQRFAELMAFTQFLPGPASSQLGMLQTTSGATCGVCWRLLSALRCLAQCCCFLAGWGVLQFDGAILHGTIHGLMVAVVAIVTKAILDMTPKLCPSSRHMFIALIAAAAMLMMPVG